MTGKPPGAKPGLTDEDVPEGSVGTRTMEQGGEPRSSHRLDLRRSIAAPQKEVWEALTDAKLLSKWFTTRAKVDLKVGGRYSNGDGDEGSYLAIDSGRRLRFSWENREHCPDTVVEVSIAPRGAAAVDLRLTHSKLRSHADREEMKQGWSWALDSLKAFLETGEPLRHKDWLEGRRTKR